MASIQSSSQQDMLGILSPEAKVFVPRLPNAPVDVTENGMTPDSSGMTSSVDEPVLQNAVNGLPSYMTTCYPFVYTGEPRYGGGRMRGKFSSQMYVPPNFQPMQSGMPRNRFPHPSKNFMPPAAWNQTMAEMYPPFANVPNGMPFDGGTFQNGLIHPSHMTVHDPKSVITQSPTFPSSFQNPDGYNPHMLNGFGDTQKPPWSKSHKPLLNGEDSPARTMNGLGPKGDYRNVCFKTTSIQTDFPEHLANSTLEDIPNSLFNTSHKPSTRRSKHKFRSKHRSGGSGTCTDSANESDSGYSSALHRKNQVSNGTNPGVNVGVGGNGVAMATTRNHVINYLSDHAGYNSCVNSYSTINSMQVVGSTTTNNNSVPYPSDNESRKFSYASIAQSRPSQKNKRGQENCDSSGKKLAKSNANSSLNNVNVNVADIIEDLEKADSLKNNKNNLKLSQSVKNVKNSNNNVLSRNTDVLKISNFKTDVKQNNTSTRPTPTVTVATKQPEASPNVTVATKQPQPGSYATATTKQPQPGSYATVTTKQPQPGSYATVAIKEPQPGSYATVATKQPQPGSYATVSTKQPQPGSYVNHLQKQQQPGSYGNTTNSQPGSYGNSKQQLPGSYSSVTKNVLDKKSSVSVSIQGHTSANHGIISTGEGHICANDLDGNENTEGQTQGQSLVNGEETEVKKKRRRRRRRKKKGGDNDEGDGDDDANSGANDDVLLHFEDEEEFPDLSGPAIGDKQTPCPSSTVFSYSDILKNNSNTPVQSTKSSTDELCSQETSQEIPDAPVKETRNSRKRRKRRESANKAADVEMAEINLEQHMLELKMKQKHPLTAKKSVSPVRNPSTQGVWKLPPSSPANQSSTGKKVSLLLPGTVAPEPITPASPVPVNPAAKQHGILKTSQPVSQPVSIASSGKKSKQSLTYDLGAMIDALEMKKLEPKKEVKPVVIKKEDLKQHNLLDSSAPAKRGKERETPKCKKPSPLKKVILKEREEKKRLRMLDDDDVNSGAPVGIGIVSGESDLSQDAGSSKGSMEVSLGTPASAELSPISQPSPSCMSPMSPGASPLSSGVNSPITGAIQQTVKLKIHSRRFREYCNQVLDKEIDNCVTALLQDLVRFQDKQFHKDPVKAKSKRRFVLGLREVTKHLKLKKVKCVIISPNLEKIQSKGGLDDALNSILELCNEQVVPFIFALGRRALGRACAKLVPVSVVGIFNYEGSEENFKSLVGLTEKAREAYREMIVQIEKEIAEQPVRSSVPGVPHIFAHMGHSRTPSGCSVISFTSSILSEPISENYPYSEPETDNRGYEIEKKPEESSDVNQSCIQSDEETGRDPYEADDESGHERPKRSQSKTITAKAEMSQIDAEAVDINVDKCKNDLTDSPQEVTQANVTPSVPLVVSPHSTDDYSKNDAVNKGANNNCSGDLIDNLSDDEDEKELDFETCDEDSDNDQSKEGEDTVEELPHFIDSVHHFDLNEILSQHSSKTMENGEDVMSTHSSKTTHSSRTLGDGSTIHGDKTCKVKVEIKNAENSNTLLKGKTNDDKENRTLSWVKEAQNLHFNDQAENTSESEENSVDVMNVSIECLDAVA